MGRRLEGLFTPSEALVKAIWTVKFFSGRGACEQYRDWAGARARRGSFFFVVEEKCTNSSELASRKPLVFEPLRPQI